MFMQQSFQCMFSASVCCNESSFLWIDFEAKPSEALLEISICFNSLLCNLEWRGAFQIKANVIYPAGQVSLWVLLLPGNEGRSKDCLGQQRCLRTPSWYSMIHMKEWCQLLLSQNGFWATVELHSQFQHKWRVVQSYGLFLQLGEVDGVIQRGHVHEDCYAMLLSRFCDLLSEEPFQRHMYSTLAPGLARSWLMVGGRLLCH